jgi:hypothetical protein
MSAKEEVCDFGCLEAVSYDRLQRVREEPAANANCDGTGVGIEA